MDLSINFYFFNDFLIHTQKLNIFFFILTLTTKSLPMGIIRRMHITY